MQLFHNAALPPTTPTHQNQNPNRNQHLRRNSSKYLAMESGAPINNSQQCHTLSSPTHPSCNRQSKSPHNSLPKLSWDPMPCHYSPNTHLLNHIKCHSTHWSATQPHTQCLLMKSETFYAIVYLSSLSKLSHQNSTSFTHMMLIMKNQTMPSKTQQIAYTSLIEVTPSLTHEFPSFHNPFHIHDILTSSTQLCRCSTLLRWTCWVSASCCLHLGHSLVKVWKVLH